MIWAQFRHPRVRISGYARSGEEVGGHPACAGVSGEPAAQRSSRASPPRPRAGAPRSRRRGRSTARVGHVLGIDGQARREAQAAGLGRRAQALDIRPRRLRVHVVDRHRRDTAPVVDPRVEQPRELVVAEVRRRLDVPPGPSSTRAAAAVHSSSSSDGSWCEAIRVPGLARKFWTITSCTCPYRSPSSRIASSDSIRSRRVSPMPIRIPVVNGTAASPASRNVSSRRRALVRRAEVRPAARRQPSRRGLEHHPLRRAHATAAREIVGGPSRPG